MFEVSEFVSIFVEFDTLIFFHRIHTLNSQKHPWWLLCIFNIHRACFRVAYVCLNSYDALSCLSKLKKNIRRPHKKGLRLCSVTHTCTCICKYIYVERQIQLSKNWIKYSEIKRYLKYNEIIHVFKFFF